MERTELRSVENFKSLTGGDKCYKKLYHESVERCAILQSQLAEFSKLLSKFERIEKLKVYIVLWLKTSLANEGTEHFSGLSFI